MSGAHSTFGRKKKTKLQALVIYSDGSGTAGFSPCHFSLSSPFLFPKGSRFPSRRALSLRVSRGRPSPPSSSSLAGGLRERGRHPPPSPRLAPPETRRKSRGIGKGSRAASRRQNRCWRCCCFSSTADLLGQKHQAPSIGLRVRSSRFHPGNLLSWAGSFVSPSPRVLPRIS